MADNMGDEAGHFLSSRSASLAGELEALIAEIPRCSLAAQNAALRAENADLNDELERWRRWWHDANVPTLITALVQDNTLPWETGEST
jgi:sigma54-dependent transcription regulator